MNEGLLPTPRRKAIRPQTRVLGVSVAPTLLAAGGEGSRERMYVLETEPFQLPKSQSPWFFTFPGQLGPCARDSEMPSPGCRPCEGMTL